MLSGVTIENEIYQFSDIVPGEKQSSNQWFSVWVDGLCTIDKFPILFDHTSYNHLLVRI